MMLQHWIAYADREKLDDPDFRKMPVRWEIALDEAGKFTALSSRVSKIQTRRKATEAGSPTIYSE